ncbi:MAG: hypothetical protein QOF21_1829 [Actinomycetota bacterium]
MHPERDERTLVAQPVVSTTSSTAPTTTTTAPPAPTTVQTAPPPTTPPTVRAAVAAPVKAAPVTVAPAPKLRTDAPLMPGNPAAFKGFGAWIDVYDWSAEFTGGQPVVGPREVDRMADLGVQALYVQASKQRSANDVVDRGLLEPIINRAHQHGMRVIVWYAPTLEDPARDLRKLLAIASLGIEGVGMDIESRAVSDVPERNRRLVDLSIALRQHLPTMPLAAVVMPAVLLEVVNPNFWPAFPYREIAPAYDVWMPMSYWTSRKQASGYREGYRYTAENIDRLRAQLGRADLPVHPIGGIGDESTPDDIDGLVRAAAERGALGGSIYDYRTTGDALWARLQSFRS